MMAKSIETERGGNIRTVMETKADKTELSELWNIKSSKKELEVALKAIDIQHHQLLHTIVMILELIKYQTKHYN